MNTIEISKEGWDMHERGAQRNLAGGMEKRVCKKCSASIAKDQAHSCVNCRRIFCDAHLVPVTKSGNKQTTTFSFYCEPCERLKFGNHR